MRKKHKITREDGSYVELKYDGALRLTNELYKTSGGSVIEEIGYAYDAAGSRIKLVKGGVTLTNSVSGGYRITAVNNAANGSTLENYTYDNGGRVMSIARDSATLNLGYNSVDQVTAVTNGANWVTYTHDASGRRTFSTNNTTVRKFLVASTPGTDLESPQLIANASGAVQQGYVYLGDDPILRFSTSGTAAYYLEDGMGSVIGLAPATSPGTGNTTRIFYDGFGNTRTTVGPTPTIPTGTGGDFRFHGAWLEEQSGLYHMRAREYDARMGRFTSADPLKGAIELAEEFHPFAFANNNAFVFSDPSGLSPSTEQSVVSFVQTLLNTLRVGGAHQAKKKAYREISDILIGWAKDSVSSYLLKSIPINLGTQFGNKARKVLCFGNNPDDPDGGAGNISGYVHFEVPVDEFGEPLGPGLSCNRLDKDSGKPLNPGEEKRFIPGRKLKNGALIDMVISSAKPVSGDNRKPGAAAKTWATMELKYSTGTVANDYFGRNRQKKNQLTAMFRYTSKHTYSKMGVILVSQYTNKMNRKTFPVIERRIKAVAAGHHCLTDVVIMTDLGKKRKRGK